MTGYAETHRRSLEKPEAFWAEAAEAISAGTACWMTRGRRFIAGSRARGSRRRRHRQIQSPRDRSQARVARPQGRARCQACGGQQVRIDVTDAEPVERLLLDKMEHLPVGGEARLRQRGKRVEDEVALA